MNRYASLRKLNKRSLSAALVLALCVLLSGIALFSRLTYFVTQDPTHYIPLTTDRGNTRVTVTQTDGPRTRAPRTAPTAMLAATPFLTVDWFQTRDENTIWTSETDIEIFRMSYDNSAGDVTVHSAGGDKVLAPGTENTYAFALENTGRHNLKFTMSMEAFFSDGTHVIPVEVRVFDHEGTYFAGSEEGYVEAMALNQVSDSGSLKPGYVMPYTLQWRWPFEVDDEYDTMLGNLAVQEDISLTVIIRTTASYTPDADDGIPSTGDDVRLMMYCLPFVGSLCGLVLLLHDKPGREEEYA